LRIVSLPWNQTANEYPVRKDRRKFYFLRFFFAAGIGLLRFLTRTLGFDNDSLTFRGSFSTTRSYDIRSNSPN
jgi:hypothetical protein